MKHPKILFCLAATLLATFLVWSHFSGPQIITATISNQPQQEFKGWGLYPCTFQLDRPNAENFHIFNRPNAQKLLFQDLGANIMRAEILPESWNGALDEKYLENSLVRWLKVGQKWGVKNYILSVWSPPAAFKNPPTTLGELKKQTARLREDREDDFCRFVVQTLRFLEARGLRRPLAFSVQNEPNYAPDLWNGCQYSPEQWTRVVAKTRRAFDQNGFQNVALIGPEAGNYAESARFLGDKSVLNDLGGFAWHGYTIYSSRADEAANLRKTALEAQNRGKDLWMTEWSILKDKQAPIDHALEVSQRLAREMAFIPTNYWFWWQGWYFRGPKGTVLLNGRDDKKLQISKTFWVLKRLWNNVAPASRVFRVETDSEEIRGFGPEVQIVAWKKDAKTTVLIVNPTDKLQMMNLSGLSGQNAEVFVSDAMHDMKSQDKTALANSVLRLELAPRAIFLVTSR